jgi:lysophospholipase L1-like esterase
MTRTITAKFPHRMVLTAALMLVGLFITANAQAQWKYTALGDSLTTGYLATQGYVPRYQSDIQTDTGVSVVLYNLGQNGWASGNLLHALQTDSVFQNALMQSDIVTWDIGLNDFKIARSQYKNGGCGGNDGQNCLRNAVATFKSNWDGIVREILLRRSPFNTIVRTIDIYDPWVKTDKAANSVSDKREPAYAKGTDFQVIEYYLDQMNNYIATTTTNNSIPCASVHLAFNGVNGDEDPIAKGYIASDGLHPSDTGHQVIADVLRGLGYVPLR